jgi:F-type H+-transporting ATPase subunit b
MKSTAPMMAMTWAVFLLTFIILYRVAWKPILRALDTRESKVRKSVEDAEKARKESADTETRCRAMLADAAKQSQQIVENGRATADELARAIEARARDETVRSVENAKREIEAATLTAKDALRRESADLAVSIAGKLVRENMDTARNRTLSARRAGEM